MVVLKLLATGFYLGLLPKAPGTFGTLLGIPLSYLFLSFGPFFYLVATLLFVLISIVVTEFYSKTLQEHDSPSIVMDEVAGYLVAFTALPFHIYWIVLAFLLFRFFDIFKPFPISRLDQIPGGMGIVLDDVGAGLMTNIILQILFVVTNS